MECKMANFLMMKYMDFTLEEKEAESLNSHLLSCESCKEDFQMYETLLTEFEKEEPALYEPPICFCDNIMEKIMKIEPDFCKPQSQENVLSFVFGAFSMLVGIGVILSMYKTEILALSSQYPVIGTIMNGASEISQSIILSVNGIILTVSGYANDAMSLIDSAKYGILALIAVLVVAQGFVYYKNKVEVDA